METAADCTAAEAATDSSVIPAARVATRSVTDAATIAVAAYAAISITTAIAVAAVEASAIIAVIPGAGTDEDAANEPVWSIKAVGSASIWIVGVVAVSADWRSDWIVIPVSGIVAIGSPYPDTDGNLGIRAQHSSRAQEQAEKQKVT